MLETQANNTDLLSSRWVMKEFSKKVKEQLDLAIDDDRDKKLQQRIILPVDKNFVGTCIGQHGAYVQEWKEYFTDIL